MGSSIVRVVSVPFCYAFFFYQCSATSLALHYLDVNRVSPSDLKAIVVMGSMGRNGICISLVVSNALAFKRLGCPFPLPPCTAPANTLCSVSLVL